MKPGKILEKAFREGTSDTQLRRLLRYAESGKPFLCGADTALFCRDGLG